MTLLTLPYAINDRSIKLRRISSLVLRCIKLVGDINALTGKGEGTRKPSLASVFVIKDVNAPCTSKKGHSYVNRKADGSNINTVSFAILRECKIDKEIVPPCTPCPCSVTDSLLLIRLSASTTSASSLDKINCKA